ncbi:hypothetical protein PMAYCL1PPCAC_22945, partial [Pristionchus mayeri]
PNLIVAFGLLITCLGVYAIFCEGSTISFPFYFLNLLHILLSIAYPIILFYMPEYADEKGTLFCGNVIAYSIANGVLCSVVMVYMLLLDDFIDSRSRAHRAHLLCGVPIRDPS